jgi:carbonic anhydrase
MANKEVLKFIAGFRRFRDRYFNDDDSVYRRVLQTGQSPKTMIIACSDSRVDPAMLSGASPGDIFVVRNVANLVPPFEVQGKFHGVSSAIEFAVENIRVENIIVLGHRQCGGIRALMMSQTRSPSSFVGRWMEIAREAKEKVLAGNPPASTPEEEDALCRHCELESIIVSMQNLKTFPFIQNALKADRLELHGVYFDLESGELSLLNQQTGLFENLPV